MNRREVLSLGLVGSAALAVGAGLPTFVFAEDQKTFVLVAKTVGDSWTNLLEKGITKAGQDLKVKTSVIGTTHSDPAEQVNLIEDLIAKKVNAIGVLPLDSNVLTPVLKRAREAGIAVITQEGPNQNEKTWDVEMIDSTNYGETQMKALAREIGEQGDYAIVVGTLTTPLHNFWADAAIAYQKEHYPNMHLVADRFPGADNVDASAQLMRDLIKAYPNIKGVILFGAGGPIGAGNVLRERRLTDKIAVVGSVIPSMAKQLIDAGAIREGFLWNPAEAGYAMVAVAKLEWDGVKIANGTDVPGLGKAIVDPDKRIIAVNRMLDINKQTVDGLIAQGL
jgi:simple sugar transport system substrate-binding protein